SRLSSGFMPNTGTPRVKACFLYLLRFIPVHSWLNGRSSSSLASLNDQQLAGLHKPSDDKSTSPPSGRACFLYLLRFIPVRAWLNGRSSFSFRNGSLTWC